MDPTAEAPLDHRFFAVVIGIDRLDLVRRTLGRESTADLLASIACDAESALGASATLRPYRSSIEGSFRAASAIEAEARARACSEQIGRSLDLGGFDLAISLHIGLADCADASTAEDRLEAAAAACNCAMTQHRRVVLVEAEKKSQAAERLALMRALQTALRQDRLELHYQPKVGARTLDTHSVEALIRWTDPELGALRPDVFIPLAEESGDIRALTEWIVVRAIEDQSSLLRDGIKLPVHLNISSTLLADQGYAWSLLERCTALQGELGFEITETAMMAEPEVALNNLLTWAKAGVKLAIDDYGTGFSSLAYLRRLPVDELKIDRVFISALSTSHRDPLLVRSTIDLAHALEMKVTAEGVDTPEAMALLQVMGCDLLQGYHLSRPLSLPDLRDFLRRKQADTDATNPIDRIRDRLSRKLGRPAAA